MVSKTKLKWKDITSHGRDSIRECVPRILEANCGPMRVIVTRHIDYDPKDWLLRFGLNDRVLKGDLTVEAALLEAEKQLTTYFKRALAALAGR